MAGVWITGGHGFIGRHLARYLATSGRDVFAIGHGHWPEAEARAWGVSRWLNAEVRSSSLEALRSDHGPPDTIFHLAGGSSVGASLVAPREDFDRTVASTADLLEWMRRESPGAALVVASSAAVYGAGHEGPICESGSQGSPFSPYGYHKYAMELLCRSYGQAFGLRTVVARLFSVYGPGLKKQLLWDLCTRLVDGAPGVTLGGTGEELRDWIHVADVVRLLDRLSEEASNDIPVFNAGTGEGTTVRRIAELVREAWGSSAALAFSGQSRVGDPFSLIADNARLNQTGFVFNRPLVAGIQEYVRWFHEQRIAGA